MDIRDLNKTQIVLLTLLVSFVTSIATGIVTVSLMQQAPQSVTQTINKVIERTIERVVPTNVTSGTKETVTKETTVVVKEEDLITKSIEQNKPAIVAVQARSVNTDGSPLDTFIGWGTVLTENGRIATDAALISDGGNYTILTEDGKVFAAKVIGQNEKNGVAIVDVVREKDNESSEKYVFTKSKEGNPSILRLGQTLIAFGGIGKKSVSVGILSSINEETIPAENATSTPKQKVTGIEANIVPVGNITGGPIINSFGEVIGISFSVGLSDRSAVYLPISIVEEEANSIK